MITEFNKNQGLAEAALEIAKQRRNTLVLARLATRAGNVKEADRLLAELVPDEELHRALESKHDGTGRRGSRVVAFPKNR